MASDGDVTRTSEGTVAGTAAYMSPEQARGQSARRALRRLQLRRSSSTRFCQARAPSAGTPLRRSCARCCVTTRRRCERCPPSNGSFSGVSQRTRRDRYQTMARGQRRRWKQARRQSRLQDAATLDRGAALREHERAILMNEYFSDGLAEEIINALDPRAGAEGDRADVERRSKGKHEDVRRIAGTLGSPRDVLEGSVRKAGNRIRVTAQLIPPLADGRAPGGRSGTNASLRTCLQSRTTSRMRSHVGPSGESWRAGPPSIHSGPWQAYEALLRGPAPPPTLPPTPTGIVRARE